MTTALDFTGEAYHHTATDVDTLHRLVSGLSCACPLVIVNIGACFGTSVIAILEASPTAFVFSIDVHPCPEEMANIREAGLDASSVVRVLGRSQDVALVWPQRVDMVFVDGSHLYRDVYEDAVRWSALLASGGVIAFHDYDRPPCTCVKSAVDSAMAGHEPFLHVESIVAFRG